MIKPRLNLTKLTSNNIKVRSILCINNSLAQYSTKQKVNKPPQGDPSLNENWFKDAEQAKKEFEEAEKLSLLYNRAPNSIIEEGEVVTNYHTKVGELARDTSKLSQLPKVLVKGVERILQDNNKEELREAALKLFSAQRTQINTSGKFSLPKNYAELRNRPQLAKAGNKPEFVQYGELESLGYLGGLFPSAFGACKRVFEELVIRDKNFKPTKIMDFGTGPGTAIWAAKEIWGIDESSSLKNYTGIDISQPQLDLTAELFNQYEKENIEFPGEIELLPYLNYNATPSTRSDLVVSSYTLSELPNNQLRDQIIQVLWEYTNNALVIIERGTPSGYQVIERVRELLVLDPKKKIDELYTSGEDNISEKVKELPKPGHILAPCNFQGVCPMSGTFRWCHFQQKVQRPKFMMSIKQTKSNHEQHAFSYIIIQKHAPLPDETSTWSRIVDQPSKRGQHVILNTCTSRGKIERMVIPKSQGKGEFRDARKSRWGDLFPHEAKNGTQEVKLKPEEFKYRNRRYDHVEFIDEDDD